MATIVSASSATVTSILGTISTLAHTTQRTINTAAASLDMLDTYVESARQRQSASTKIASSLYLENLLQELSAEQARKEKILHQELNADPNLKTLFSDNYAKLSALFTETHPAP